MHPCDSGHNSTRIEVCWISLDLFCSICVLELPVARYYKNLGCKEDMIMGL